MEKGYVVITAEEYKKMIEEKINNENYKEELISREKEKSEVFEKIEKYLFEKIISNEGYHLKNMKKCSPTDYHYQELYTCFLDIGIDNMNYIHSSIETLKQKFDNETSKNIEKEREKK